MNQTCTRKIEFVNGEGATGKIVITPNGTLEVIGNVSVTGNITATGTVTAADFVSSSNGSFNSHKHISSTAGTPTGVPVQ